MPGRDSGTEGMGPSASWSSDLPVEVEEQQGAGRGQGQRAPAGRQRTAVERGDEGQWTVALPHRPVHRPGEMRLPAQDTDVGVPGPGGREDPPPGLQQGTEGRREIGGEAFVGQAAEEGEADHAADDLQTARPLRYTSPNSRSRDRCSSVAPSRARPRWDDALMLSLTMNDAAARNATNATFRFHRLRPGQSWTAPDLDADDHTPGHPSTSSPRCGVPRERP